MHILVDADSCPGIIKDILYRAVERTRTQMTLVADRPLTIPSSSHIKKIQVQSGLNAADIRIIDLAQPGDLIITDDIPLASAVVNKGALVLSQRGEMLRKENVAERLSARDFMTELRENGINTGGPAPLSQKNRQSFANQLDRLLVQQAVVQK
ncbi:MAG: YaiI/YqxD family protein [Proteobacteria bacterium]|nr:YaiI/YqxD family protein [Pseudomonadota bacterium]MBU1649441.1 YaiI/YqxD family protein [Pseudomonadota bacterium]